MASKCTDKNCTDKNTCKNVGGNCECPSCKKKKSKGGQPSSNYKGPVQSSKQAASQDKASGNKNPAPYSPAEARKEAYWQRMQKGK